MDDADLGLRNLTYALYVELARGPSAGEVAERAGAAREDVLAGCAGPLRDLAGGRAAR
jgi:hypothetical protein